MKTWILALIGLLIAFPVRAQRPGPIENIIVRQTGPGIVTANWDPHPEGILYVIRYGPVGVPWWEKFDPDGDFQNEHRTGTPAFVLSGVAVGQTGEIQVVAFDSIQTGNDRYGPISDPVAFEVTEWENPDPSAPDTVQFPITTEAVFHNSTEFYLTLPDGQVIKMGRLGPWFDAGWFGIWGVWVGMPNN